MKAIVGIDDGGYYRPALGLLGRIGFPDAELRLVHVEDPTGTPEMGIWAAEVIEEQQKIDDEVLAEAESAAAVYGMKVLGKQTCIGQPAGILLDEADAVGADLVAVGSTQKSRFGCFFFGSVGRALAIGCSKSVLIGKGGRQSQAKVRAIFATDHSEYAGRALQRLIGMKPSGFEKITLLTALDGEMLKGADEIEAGTMSTYMEGRSAKEAELLKEAGISADFHVTRGELAPAIDQQMKQRGAELLVMGAQGHSFIERLLIGSSALHQVVVTEHSVLILRP